MRTALLIVFFWGAFISTGRADSTGRIVERGNELYRQKDYAGSAGKYKEGLQKVPESDIMNFNIGTAYYQQGDYPDTISHLQKSLLSDNADLQAGSHYNLGNAYYRYGLTKEDQDIAAAIADLEESLVHYEKSLAIHPQDEDAQYNREVVRQEIERLKEKKKQQEQQQNQQPKQQPSQKSDQQDDQQQQEASQESSSGEGQQNQPSGQEQTKTENQPQEEQGEEGKSSSPKEQPGQSSGPEQQQQPPEPSESRPSSKTEGTQGLTRQEAEMLLNHYQQKEEPQGLLNFMKRKGVESPVQKDW